MHWCAFNCRKRLDESALILQNMYRSKVARRAIVSKREAFNQRVIASSIIVNAERRRKSTLILKSMKAFQQEELRALEVKDKALKAAKVIERTLWRCRHQDSPIFFRKLREAQNMNLNNEAITIQRVFRGIIQRNYHRKCNAQALLLQRRIRKIIAQKEILRRKLYYSSKIVIWFRRRRRTMSKSIEPHVHNKEDKIVEKPVTMQRGLDIDSENRESVPSYNNLNSQRGEEDDIVWDLGGKLVPFKQSLEEYTQDEEVEESNTISDANDQWSSKDNLSSSVTSQTILARLVRGFITRRKLYANLFIVRAAKRNILRGRRERGSCAAIMIQCHVRGNIVRKMVSEAAGKIYFLQHECVAIFISIADINDRPKQKESNG